MTIDHDGLAKLREPFPPESVSKLPKGKEDKSKRRRCNECGGYHDPSMFHLDYVGHAALTDRLLTVDPEWTWEPFATDERGAPLLDVDGQGRTCGLWIRLTVCGMTRPGYGSCDPGKPDAVKELIGDALRNAGMRFGMALDLWHKGDLPTPESEADVLRARAAEWTGSDDDRRQQVVEWLNGMQAKGVHDLDDTGLAAFAEQLDEWEAA